MTIVAVCNVSVMLTETFNVMFIIINDVLSFLKVGSGSHDVLVLEILVDK